MLRPPIWAKYDSEKTDERTNMVTESFPVMLTFDIDGETLWLNRDCENESRPVVMSLGSYGPKIGVRKIRDLLDEFAVRATFFVPGWIAERYPQMVAELDRDGHEVAHHGYLHEWLDGKSKLEEEEILKRGIDAIAQVLGKSPVGYRAPAWRLTVNSYDLLLDHGFKYGSNMMDADGPYIVRSGDKRQLVELPVSWSLDDSSLYLYDLQLPNPKLTSNEEVLSIWCGEFDGLYKDGSGCVLTVHPQLTGRSYRLQALRRFIEHARSRPRVRFMRCEDVAAAMIKGESL